MYNTMLSLD